VIDNPALAAEKHPSHDKRVSTILSADGSHICCTDSRLIPVLLREALAQRETP
jgi:hypothetical protein